MSGNTGPSEDLVRLAAAQHLLDQARVDLHDLIQTQEAITIGMAMAAEQVQEVRLNLLENKPKPPEAQVIFTVLLAVALEVNIVGRALKGFSVALGKRCDGLATAKITEAYVKRWQLPIVDFSGRVAPYMGQEGAFLKALKSHFVENGKWVSQNAVRLAQQSRNFAANMAIRASKVNYEKWNTAAKTGLATTPALKLLEDKPPGPLGSAQGWPAEVIISEDFDTNGQPQRLIQPGFKPNAGVPAFSVRLRKEAELFLAQLKAGTRALIDDLQWRIHQAHWRLRGIATADINAQLDATDAPAFLLPGDADALAPAQLLEQAADLSSRVATTEPGLAGGGAVAPVSGEYNHVEALADAYFVAYEKTIWMAAAGNALGITKPEQVFMEGEAARDRREIFVQGPITKELVQYWWARFPNPETGLPFQNQHQLYTHLVSIRDSLKKLGADAKMQLPKEKG